MKINKNFVLSLLAFSAITSASSVFASGNIPKSLQQNYKNASGAFSPQVSYDEVPVVHDVAKHTAKHHYTPKTHAKNTTKQTQKETKQAKENFVSDEKLRRLDVPSPTTATQITDPTPTNSADYVEGGNAPTLPVKGLTVEKRQIEDVTTNKETIIKPNNWQNPDADGIKNENGGAAESNEKPSEGSFFFSK
jgi:hypothetical protein